MAENCSGTMHNLYTLRGAEVRDANGWARYITEAQSLFPDAEVVFQAHNWPHWGKAVVSEYLTNTAAVYMGIVMDTEKLQDRSFTINLKLTDGDDYLLKIHHGVLLYYKDALSDAADLTLSTPRIGILAITSGNQENIQKLVTVEKGDAALFQTLCDSMAAFDLYFNIIEP